MNKICSKHLSEPVKLDIKCVGCELELIRSRLNKVIEEREEEKKIMLRLLIMFIGDDQLEILKQFGDLARKYLIELEEEKSAKHKTKIANS